MRPTDDLDAIVTAIRAGAGYRLLAEELVRAVAAAELPKRRSAKDVVKAARSKLHQLVGAYDDLPRDALTRLKDAEPAELPAVARELLASHASTRERLPAYQTFWQTVLRDMAPPATVLDLACGLNPLSLTAGALPAETVYRACDVHLGLLELCGGYLARLGQPHEVFAHDLLSGPPAGPADLVLLLKTIPCLEQADKAAGRRLLAAIEAPVLVVSFPVRSLGGKQVGMADHYAARLTDLLRGLPWQSELLDPEGELVYRLTRA